MENKYSKTHTPTPWEFYYPSTHAEMRDGEVFICEKDMGGYHAKAFNVANAAHIVHCVNMHDELQSVIDAQRAALHRLRHEIFYGGVDEINKVIDDALSLGNKDKTNEQ